jgi:hypothetical protein
MTIAYPAIPVDTDCITQADTILGWIVSKGNKPAKSRRQELRELQRLALQINNAHGWPPLASRTARSFQDSSWLWNAVTIDGETPDPNVPFSSTNLIGAKEFETWFSGELAEDQWFWAENEQPNARNDGMLYEGGS